MLFDVKMMGFWFFNNWGTKLSQIYQIYLGRETSNLSIHMKIYTLTLVHEHIHIRSIWGTLHFFKLLSSSIFCAKSDLFSSKLYFMKSWLPWRQNRAHFIRESSKIYPPLSTFLQQSFIYTFRFSKIPSSNTIFFIKTWSEKPCVERTKLLYVIYGTIYLSTESSRLNWKIATCLHRNATSCFN